MSVEERCIVCQALEAELERALRALAEHMDLDRLDPYFSFELSDDPNQRVQMRRRVFESHRQTAHEHPD